MELNPVSIILVIVLKPILEKVEEVKKATNSYRDDIFVDETMMSTTDSQIT